MAPMAGHRFLGGFNGSMDSDAGRLGYGDPLPG
jgi:hypothetical protein